MSLDPEKRARVEQYVRPLYTELDGVDTFGKVLQIERRLKRLSEEAVEHDPVALELLTLFHGVAARLGNLGEGGRWQLFLRGLGLDDSRIARLRSSLKRYADDPRSVEERMLHDAVLLERTGVRAAVATLLAAGKKKLSVDRAIAQLDAGPDPARFRTAAGQAIARTRREAAEGWIASLQATIAGESMAERGGPSLE